MRLEESQREITTYMSLKRQMANEISRKEMGVSLKNIYGKKI
jgi:hypothetical protein